MTISSSGVPIDMSNGVPGWAPAARMGQENVDNRPKVLGIGLPPASAPRFLWQGRTIAASRELLIRQEAGRRWLSGEVETTRRETVRRKRRGLYSRCGGEARDGVRTAARARGSELGDPPNPLTLGQA